MPKARPRRMPPQRGPRPRGRRPQRPQPQPVPEQAAPVAVAEPTSTVVTLPKTIAVGDLARALDVSVVDVIRGLVNVGLMVSNPSLNAREVKTPVATSQVAASILKALGIDPRELQAVRREGTEVLPFLFSDGGW